MKNEIQKILDDLKDGEFIASKELSKYTSNYDDDEEVKIWISHVDKAKREATYRRGAYLMCDLAGMTPTEFIARADEEGIKAKGSAEAFLDLCNILKRTGKARNVPYAPKSRAAWASGALSFFKDRASFQLPPQCQKAYKEFQRSSEEHKKRYQTTVEDFYRVIDHSDVTQKAMIGFLASTGVANIDIETMFVPHGFFKQIKAAEENEYPSKKLAPMVHWWYERSKIDGSYGYLWLAGDALTWWLDYANKKGIQEGEPFFIGHNRKPITKGAVYDIVTSAANCAGVKMTPKMLREYASGQMKDEGVHPDIIRLITAHMTGEVAEAYTAKNALKKAYLKIWKSLNPYLAREYKSIEVEQKNQNLEEEITDIKGQLKHLNDLVVSLLTSQNKEAISDKFIEGVQDAKS